MELTFAPWRVAALVGLMVGFALLGGFSFPPEMGARMVKVWALSILLFTLSAISATVVDHWVGNLDRSNFRWFYIVIGIAGMAGALMNLHVLRERVKIDQETSSLGDGGYAGAHWELLHRKHGGWQTPCVSFAAAGFGVRVACHRFSSHWVALGNPGSNESACG